MSEDVLIILLKALTTFLTVVLIYSGYATYRWRGYRAMVQTGFRWTSNSRVPKTWTGYKKHSERIVYSESFWKVVKISHTHLNKEALLTKLKAYNISLEPDTSEMTQLPPRQVSCIED